MVQNTSDDLKEFYKSNAKLGLPEEDSEGDIVKNYQTNALYKHDFKGGNYFVLVDENLLEMQISERIKFTVAFIKKKNDINSLRIEKFVYKGNKWIEDEKEKITLSKFTFEKLIAFLDFLSKNNLADFSERKLALTDEFLEGVDDETKENIFNSLKNEKKVQLVKTLLDDGSISSSDLVSLGYRKRQLDNFNKLLNDKNFFGDCKKKLDKKRDEDVWQYFFEKNSWIFGYGLSYVFCVGYDDDKLEQVVSGYDFSNAGKRVDGFLSTLSDIQQFALVEIKLPDDKLVSREVRSACWAVSNEVNDGVAQIQKTTHKFKENYFSKVDEKNDAGFLTGRTVYNFVPQSYLIIGRLNSFMGENGINEEQYSSFQLYRDSITKPQIITYDELYNRAKFIVKRIEQ